MNSGIYCIVNLINQKYYIGSATNLSRRINRHWYELDNGVHHSIKLQRAFDKYGAEAFEFRIIADDVEIEQLIQFEQFWINHLNAVNDGYNVCPTAGTCHGRKLTAEHKHKISVTRKDQKMHPHTEEQKRERSERMKGDKNPWYGKSPSSDARHKMSDAKKGRKLSEEQKQKISEGLRKHNLIER